MGYRIPGILGKSLSPEPGKSGIPSVDPWIPIPIPGTSRAPAAPLPRTEMRNSPAPAPAGSAGPGITPGIHGLGERIPKKSLRESPRSWDGSSIPPHPPHPPPSPSLIPIPASPTQSLGETLGKKRSSRSPSQNPAAIPNPGPIPGADSQENWLRRRLSHPMLLFSLFFFFPKAIPSLRERLPGNRSSLPPPSPLPKSPLFHWHGELGIKTRRDLFAAPLPAWNSGSRKKKKIKKNGIHLLFPRERLEQGMSSGGSGRDLGAGEVGAASRGLGWSCSHCRECCGCLLPSSGWKTWSWKNSTHPTPRFPQHSKEFGASRPWEAPENSNRVWNSMISLDNSLRVEF